MKLVLDTKLQCIRLTLLVLLSELQKVKIPQHRVNLPTAVVFTLDLSGAFQIINGDFIIHILDTNDDFSLLTAWLSISRFTLNKTHNLVSA